MFYGWTRLVPVIFALFFGFHVGTIDAQESPEFEAKESPLLIKRCVECHQGTEPTGNLLPMTRRGLLKGGDSGEPIAALLSDLDQRGLLEETLVVWGGEFSRMPFSEGKDAPGRNHNSYGFSMWMAGGNVNGGMNYGETDEFGFEAV